MYHCGMAPVSMYIANGMYGAFVVDLPAPHPAAKGFVLIQSEFYLSMNKAGVYQIERTLRRRAGHRPSGDAVAAGARIEAQYADGPTPASLSKR